MKSLTCLYLDQCIISELRTGQPASDLLRSALLRLEEHIFAYSDVHVREIHRSGNPLPYIEALEAIGACYLPAVEVIDEIEKRSVSLTSNIVREVIPETIDACVSAQLALEDIARLIAPLSSAGHRISIEGEIETAAGLLETYLEEVEQDLRALDPSGVHIAPLLSQLKQRQGSTVAEIRSLAGLKLQQEAREFHEEFAKKLGQVNLENIAAEEVAAFIIDKLPDGDPIRTLYPEGFGRGRLTIGTVSGFALMLFDLGVGALDPMIGS